MTEAKLYLRPNVKLEPLVDQWYAWAHLIPPATAAMNLYGRHLKIMESYVAAPQVHAAAARNRAMAGGPFIDYDGLRVEEIKQLIGRLQNGHGRLRALFEAIVELDALLRSEAQGYSLEPLYDKVPEALRGFVELVYDLNSQPAFRLIEPLLYRSAFYDTSMQSVMLSLMVEDHRPFVLSTPRLEGEGLVHLRIPFAHDGLDALFEMKRAPRTLGEIKERLGVEDRQEALFRSLLTDRAPAAYQGYSGESGRWRYFGHGCILLETASTSILVDPVLSYRYPTELPRYTYEDLPDEIDYVLITHNHQDHILFETILQLRHRIKQVVVPRANGGMLQDPSLRLMLEAIGFDNVVELDELAELRTPSGAITGLPFLGEHADLNIHSKLAYRVEVDGHVFLFAADSCNVAPELYDHLHAALGEIDVLFLGMECEGAPLSWIYGALLTTPLERKKDRTRRLSGSDYQRAMAIVERFDLKEVYVYAMGQEPWLGYVMSKHYTEDSGPIVASNRLIEACRDRGIVAERLFGEKEILLN